MAEKERDIFVVKLSDFVMELHNLYESKGEGRVLKLPCLCRNAQQSKPGCRICFEVAKRIENIPDSLLDQVFSFVFCCVLGAKVLVVKIGQDVYLAFCRSPMKHLMHLRKAAQLCQRSLDELERDWEKLPEFHSGFVEDVIIEIKEMGDEIPTEIEESMRKLGEAYGLFEFDIVIYDTLEAISKENSHHRGTVTIDFVSKPKREPIVRLVTGSIGPDEESGDVLILGMVVGLPSSGQMGDCLKQPTVRSLRDALSADRVDEALAHEFQASGDSKWEAEVRMYLERRKKPRRGWRERMTEQIGAGIDVGTSTAYTRLLHALPKSGLEDFKELVSRRADPRIHEITVRGRETLCSRVLRDLKNAMECISVERIENWETAKRALKEILSFLEPYPLMTVAPAAQKGMNRRDILIRDLLSGTSEYKIRTETALEEEELVQEYDSRFRDFEHELVAFRKMLPTLMRTNAGEFIAIFNGEVVDRDKNELELAKRICTRYRNQFVLIREVKEEVLETIALESPEGVLE